MVHTGDSQTALGGVLQQFHETVIFGALGQAGLCCCDGDMVSGCNVFIYFFFLFSLFWIGVIFLKLVFD